MLFKFTHFGVRRSKLSNNQVTGTFGKETVSFNKSSGIVPHFSSFEVPEPAAYKPVVQDSNKNVISLLNLSYAAN
jgi:hypothetical protein